MTNTAPRQRRSSASLRAAIGAERFAVWVLTGPVGRVAAFFADLAVYWWRWARGRAVNQRER